MKCFYCDRPYTLECDEDNNVRLICKFPRCKAQPCSDFHKTIEECEEDMKIIRDSWRKARR